jgi:nucleoid DNA-binding protein
MRNKQKEILEQIGNKYGLDKKQSEEIWNLFTKKIQEVISEPNKKGELGLYEAERFPVIHIDNFGKFIPNLRNIRHANLCLENKIKDEGLPQS